MERSFRIKAASDKPRQPHFTFPISLSKPISPSVNVSKYSYVITANGNDRHLCPVQSRRSPRGSIRQRSHLCECYFMRLRDSRKERSERERRSNHAVKRLSALFRTLCNYRCLVSKWLLCSGDIMFQPSDLAALTKQDLKTLQSSTSYYYCIHNAL